MAILDYQLANCSFEEYVQTNNNNRGKIDILSSTLTDIVKNELTSKQQQCVYMKFKNNLTQEEIAKKMNITQSTVSKHIATAKVTISQHLKYVMSALEKAERNVN